ncbi:MAG: tetratricopeptide repeat protein, partial [Vampirovibrionia bacterium]
MYQTYLKEANKLSLTGDYTEAIKYYKTALDIKPDEAVIYYYLGLTYFKTRTIEKALVAYKSALTLN